MSRSLINIEVNGLDDADAAIARLAIMLAKAPYQVDTKMVQAALGDDPDEARFIRSLAWASFSGTPRFIEYTAQNIGLAPTENNVVA